MKKKILVWVTSILMVLTMMPAVAFADGENVANVAKVGNTEYATIDEAIANWANGTTLTLLADVTLSDVVKLKSTEHHTLDLGTYTMTAASGKNAIEITCEGRSSASYAITVNADATNPGGITATGKACIYYSKSGSTKDRPIIRIYNGVFNGSYSINSKSNGNTNCPQVWIYGGEFNGNVNLTKNMLRVFGGTFNGWINCTGDSSAYREISGGKFKSWQFMTADADNKFWVGTSKANYDVGCYVDDEGYLVVGGPVITEPGDKFEASSANYGGWSSYLKYSSAATYGLYYTSLEIALKGDTSKVTAYTDVPESELKNFKGKLIFTEETQKEVTLTKEEEPAYTVETNLEDKEVKYADIEFGDKVNRTYLVCDEGSEPVIKLNKSDAKQFYNTDVEYEIEYKEAGSTSLIATYGRQKKSNVLSGTLTEPGEYSIVLLGKNGKEKLTFTIDKTEPTVTIETSSPDNKDGSIVVTLTSNEDVTMDGKDWTEIDKNKWQKKFTASAKEDIIFTDLAGNETSVEVDVKVIVPPAAKDPVDNAVDTSDDSNVAVPFAMMAAALALAGIACIRRRYN